MDTPARARPLTLTRILRATLLVVLVLPFATMTGMTLWVTDFSAVGRELLEARWGLLALALVGFFVQYPLLALRWRLLIDAPDGRRPPVGEMTGLMLVAHLFDLVIPGPAGDLAVSYLLKIRRGVTMAAATAAGVYGRLFGLILLAILPLALAPMFADQLPPLVDRTLDGGMVVATVGGLIMFGLAIHPRGWGWLVRTTSRVVPERWRASPGLFGRGFRSLVGYLISFAEHARRIAATPARMAGAAALSVAVIAVNVGVLYLVLLGLHERLPLGWVAFAFCVQMLSQVAGYGIPGGGNITAPVICLAVMKGLMGIDEARIVTVLFLSWTPNVVACLVGLVIAMPNLEHISRSLRNPEVHGDDDDGVVRHTGGDGPSDGDAVADP